MLGDKVATESMIPEAPNFAITVRDSIIKTKYTHELFYLRRHQKRFLQCYKINLVHFDKSQKSVKISIRYHSPYIPNNRSNHWNLFGESGLSCCLDCRSPA